MTMRTKWAGATSARRFVAALAVGATAVWTSGSVWTSETSAAAKAAVFWPYTATVTSSSVATLHLGAVVDLVHLVNLTLEDLDAPAVGQATLHVQVSPSPYACLNGSTVDVFAFHGELFLHNGLEGSQCTYGTWEIAPASITSPVAAPAIAGTAVVGQRLVVAGRRFGAPSGSVVLVGYSATTAGPVVSTSVVAWSADRVVVALPAGLRAGTYDVLLFTASGAAASILVVLRPAPPPTTGLWVQEPSGTTANLNAVSCVPGRSPSGATTGYCYAVGDGGTIVSSANGGLTWRTDVSPTAVDLNGVACVPFTRPGVRVPVICYAVGDQGTILFEKNGLPWIVVSPTSPSTTLPFSAVACQSVVRCFAVGTAVAAELTFAGATSPWQLITIPGPPGSTCGPGGPPNACLRGVAFGNSDEHFAVGGGGNVYAQFDYRGQTWTNQISLGAGYFTSISCGPPSIAGDSHCITVGTDNTLAASRIYLTSDSGATWVPAASPPEGSLPPLRGVSVLRGAPATGHAWAVGDHGTILRTDDGGKTWVKEASPTSADLLGVTCPATPHPPLLCLAVGAGGTILARRPGLSLPSWAYTATVTASSVSGLSVGATYDLIHLVNLTLEDLGAPVVGTATLHVNVARSPYACLNGSTVNVFGYDGQYFLHDGLQGAQCTYGTWEIAPASITSPAQVPTITSAAVAFSPIVSPPMPYARLLVAGRLLGSPGTASLIGYSATTAGPVVSTKVLSWAPTRVAAGLQSHVVLGHLYDALLFTSTGAAASILVRVPRIVPLDVVVASVDRRSS